MPASTKVVKRRVMGRDQTDIATFINDELKRRKGSEWRKKHEARWKEVDRQISMEPPEVSGSDPGEWHNAIQLGDLTDASETITADILRLVFPTERKFFVPHVEMRGPINEAGEEDPPPPEQQRAVNGVVRSFMVQQHKDFGVRGRVKLGLKEALHHGSVVATVDQERLFKFEGGSKPAHLKAPVPQIHSMWNSYPDSSPAIQGTELFYRGSMIIVSWVPLQVALEMPGWINKDKLQEAHSKKKLHEHIEIITYYGDIFLKRHDGNILFPNRKTVVNGTVFLESTVNKTAYSPVIYTGYERDDVRDPYFTSPIVKRAPMGKFATHMANKTMDSVDLKVSPPIAYDSLDNSMKGEGPQIYPNAKIPNRGNVNIQTLDVGDPATGLAALQWAKQDMAQGTTVDSVRAGVASGTEQTATEVIKTEQRAEVREVEFSSSWESGFMLPYLIMQHDLNLDGLETYRFYNDEPHSPDFLRFTKKNLPKNIIFEVTGSKTLLGEQERTQRFGQTAALAGQSELLARETDWTEVARQLWEDSKQKDPERFLQASDRNEEVQVALAQAQEQFEAQLQQIQQQAQQMQEALQKAEDESRAAQAKAQQSELQGEQLKLEKEQLQLQKLTLSEQLKLTREMERAESRLEDLQRDIEKRELRMQCKDQGSEVKEARNSKVLELVEKLTTS